MRFWGLKPRLRLQVRLRYVAPWLMVVVAGVALFAATESPAQRRRATAPPPEPVVTATVERRVLTEGLTMPGRVAPARPYKVLPPAAGIVASEGSGQDLIVTRSPPAVGTSIVDGSLLAAVSGRPLFVLRGDLPLYRDIEPGMQGEDVAVLQAGLRLAGFRIRDREGDYGTSTQSAIGALWENNDFEPEVDVALQEQLDEAEATLASVPPGSSEAAAAQQAVDDLEAKVGPRVPRSSIVMVPTLPATVVASDVARGTQLDAETAVVEMSALPPILAVSATQAQAARIATDMRATTTVGEIQVTGKVQVVGDPAEDGSVPITVATDEALSYDKLGTSVSVNVELTTSGGEVLAVPASAIRTNAEGHDEVVLIKNAPGNREQKPITVRVEIGVVIAGYVEIKEATPELRPGDELVVGDG